MQILAIKFFIVLDSGDKSQNVEWRKEFPDGDRINSSELRWKQINTRHMTALSAKQIQARLNALH